MSGNFRSDGVLMSWVNNTGIPRRKGSIIIDNELIGYAMEDIAPSGSEVWRANDKPILSSGTVCRCGFLEYSFNLQQSVEAWQPAYYNRAIDMVTNSSGAQASLPQPSTGNIGAAQVSSVLVSDTTIAESWILECLTAGAISVWRVAGTVSGTLSDSIVSGVWWSDPQRRISFQINEPIDVDVQSRQGDRFTWFTTAARRRIGLFTEPYPASTTSGIILLDQCKVPLKRSTHGKTYK